MKKNLKLAGLKKTTTSSDGSESYQIYNNDGIRIESSLGSDFMRKDTVSVIEYYDNNGNKINAIRVDKDGNIYRGIYEYSDDDLMVKSVDVYGIVNEFEYDTNGRIILKIKNGEISKVYTYNPDGLLHTQFNIRACTIWIYDYNSNGDIISRSIVGSTTDTHVFEYNDNGKIITLNTSDEIFKYYYNDTGNCIKFTRIYVNDKNTLPYEKVLSYNDDGLLIKTTDTNGIEETITYEKI